MKKHFLIPSVHTSKLIRLAMEHLGTVNRKKYKGYRRGSLMLTDLQGRRHDGDMLIVTVKFTSQFPRGLVYNVWPNMNEKFRLSLREYTEFQKLLRKLTKLAATH